MQRTERLLNLVQILRRHRRPVTAAAMAEELVVSVRTIYRDVGDLQSTGVPIRGEAGIGFVLDPGFDLPPLMFTSDELEALMLGASFVRERADPGLVRAAEDAVAKILAVLPSAAKPVFLDAPVMAPSFRSPPADGIDLAALRRVLRSGRKLAIHYRDEQGRETERTVWPIVLAYLEGARMLVAWCELRAGFRTFRADRIKRMEELAERCPERRAVLFKRWEEARRRERDEAAGGAATGFAHKVGRA